jgi:hypothetical protein
VAILFDTLQHNTLKFLIVLPKTKTMKLYFVLILLAASGLNSCKKSDTNSTSTFDENLKIKMSETVDSTKRTLFLDCFTEKVYGCSNYKIESPFELTNDKITINFIQIIAPNICLTSIGPAHTLIKLEGLSNKVYEVELNFGATKIPGQLDVSTNSFKATLPVQTKVQFVNPNLGRVPNNTIYGTVHYHVASATTTVQKFIDSLQFYGATSTLYPQGDYGNFQIESTGQIKQVQDAGYYFTRYYIFNYSNNSAQLKNLVRRFGVNYPDSLLVTLNTTKGETFYSWVP